MEETQNFVANQKPKRWQNYVLEFAMIFLAVTLGFFAESYRESLADENRERQLIKSFIEDLKSDTTAIREVLQFRSSKLIMMDSMMLLLRSNQIKGHENELYFYGRMLVRSLWFQSNDRTLSQFKNSDASSLIQNEQAMDSIISYQKLVQKLETNHEDDRLERYNVFPILSKMFNPFVFDSMVNANGVARPTGNPPLRSYDPSVQQDLAFYIHQIKGSSYLIYSRLNLLREKAKSTIVFLTEEYELY